VTPEAEEALRQFLWKDASEKLDNEYRKAEQKIQNASPREPTITVKTIVGPEEARLHGDASYGRKARADKSRGGRSPRTRQRDIELAREFLQRKARGDRRNDPALMALIGSRQPKKLARQTAIDAIKRGLRYLGKEDEES
jgi:hypothetical protein